MMTYDAYTERIKRLLPDEWEEFLRASACPPSLRINTLKMPPARLETLLGMPLDPVEWCADGRYYPEDFAAGKTSLHEAGAYYIQEASAMLPATLLDARPGELVLDLCAAPGGKSGQLAAAMKGKGLLVCNEVVPSRAAILSRNIERLGVRNAVVLNESVPRLQDRFPSAFDKILVDAPCSGEGMRQRPERALRMDGGFSFDMRSAPKGDLGQRRRNAQSGRHPLLQHLHFRPRRKRIASRRLFALSSRIRACRTSHRDPAASTCRLCAERRRVEMRACHAPPRARQRALLRADAQDGRRRHLPSEGEIFSPPRDGARLGRLCEERAQNNGDRPQRGVRRLPRHAARLLPRSDGSEGATSSRDGSPLRTPSPPHSRRTTRQVCSICRTTAAKRATICSARRSKVMRAAGA